MSGEVGGKGKPKAGKTSGPVTIHVAARKGNLAAVRRILEKNFNVDERSTDSGKTALHVAAQVCEPFE